jgi:hypothetical protein
MSTKEEMDFLKWLRYFWAEADFGTSHSDVVSSLYSKFKERTGIKIQELEED